MCTFKVFSWHIAVLIQGLTGGRLSNPAGVALAGYCPSPGVIRPLS
jgi:hypothetical protein